MRTEYLLDKELQHVLAALMPSNRLVCEVALHTGLRIGDVLRLKTADIKPQMTVLEQKTGKKRRIGLPADLRRRMLRQAGEVYVFEGRNDPQKHRTRQAVWYDVKRAAEAFRLPQNVAPHSIRKVYAVDLMRKYGEIAKVRRALNHSNDSITLIYAMADKVYMSKYGGRNDERDT